MIVRVQPENRELTVDDVSTVKKLLSILGFKREEVLVIDLEKKQLIPEGGRLAPDQNIEVRKVISGG